MFHICGISVHLQPICWGSNYFGQIDIPPQSHYASGITSFGTSTCILNGQGVPLCFGSNDYGQTTIPSQLSSQPFATISGGSSHVCGVTITEPYSYYLQPDGQVVSNSSNQPLPPAVQHHTSNTHCWGNNLFGETDVVTQLLGTNTSKDVSSGENHTCGLSLLGVMYCWGRNKVDEYNNGACNIPYNVQNNRVRSISAGNEITCAVVETDMNSVEFQNQMVVKVGKIYCWGETGYSMLNIPSVFNDSKYDVVKVSAGGYHVCAFTTEHIGRCWGDNNHKQLNIAMRDKTEMIEVYSGYWVTCYINSSLEIKCTGSLGKDVLMDVPDQMKVRIINS